MQHPRMMQHPSFLKHGLWCFRYAHHGNWCISKGVSATSANLNSPILQQTVSLQMSPQRLRIQTESSWTLKTRNHEKELFGAVHKPGLPIPKRIVYTGEQAILGHTSHTILVLLNRESSMESWKSLLLSEPRGSWSAVSMQALLGGSAEYTAPPKSSPAWDSDGLSKDSAHMYMYTYITHDDTIQISYFCSLANKWTTHLVRFSPFVGTFQHWSSNI